ncbi:hypothetical protein GW17_00050312 [Ensete ventricosum]|nr:hypothetical protein GW17_00050312 [Ensete ventricosum]
MKDCDMIERGMIEVPDYWGEADDNGEMTSPTMTRGATSDRLHEARQRSDSTVSPRPSMGRGLGVTSYRGQ